MTMACDVDLLEKTTNIEETENLFCEGMLRLVEMDLQIPQQHHIGL